jgi:tetratricopeptide (TPR) repeat protein
MKRTLALVFVVSVVVVGLVLAWYAVRQEREFRRLIALGDASLAREQTYVAIEAFSGALALRPDSMVAHLKRGDTYRRRGELSAALRDLRDASGLDPSATRPLELLGDVNVALGRYQRATEHYRRFITLDDRSPRVLYKLALAYHRFGQAASAIDPLRQAVAIDDRFVEAHYLLGLCLRARARVDEAQRALTKAISLNPAFSAAREELADLYTSIGRPRDGIEQLEALAAIEPTRAERMVSVGLAYARMGRTETAILTLGRAAERYAEEPAVYTALGRVWLESAELRNDRVALSKALEALQPTAGRAAASSETLALYGRALFLSGDAEGAERTLQLATTRFPVEPVAFRYLSAAAERLGHPRAARDALINYVSLSSDADDPRTLAAQIADLSLRMEDAVTALNWAARAVEGENPDAFSLGLLADAQWRSARENDARTTLAQALARDPGNRTLLRLEQRFRVERRQP